MDFTVLESVPDAMVIVGRGGRIVYVNGVTESLFGYPRAELVGQPVEVLLPLQLRGSHRAQREGYESAPYTRPMGVGLDLAGRKKNGEDFAAEVSLGPVLVGGEAYVVAAVRDITERKKIAERAALGRQAQEEVRKRDEFLSIASHELKTPVAALQLQLQMLQRVSGRSAEELVSSLRGRLDSLERQTRRIALFVNELLDVSRIRLGRLELRLQEADLVALVRETVDGLHEEAERTGSELTLHAEEPVVGRWDRLRIGQVVSNLVTNAVKFGEGNPISVSVGADPARARIVVEDRGIGIAPADHTRVFDRFERAVSYENFGGLGLGLYIAREIVHAHGGTIELRSEPGSGSAFTVELPRSRVDCN